MYIVITSFFFLEISFPWLLNFQSPGFAVSHPAGFDANPSSSSALALEVATLLDAVLGPLFSLLYPLSKCLIQSKASNNCFMPMATESLSPAAGHPGDRHLSLNSFFPEEEPQSSWTAHGLRTAVVSSRECSPQFSSK